MKSKILNNSFNWLIILVVLLSACSLKNIFPPPTQPSISRQPTHELITSLPTQTPDARRHVIIDADMGVDDSMAVLFLLKSKDISIRAITVAGTGLAHCNPGMRTALGLVALTGNGNIPVACGRETPLKGEITFPQDWREEADNLPKILGLPVSGELSDLSAAELLVSTIEAAPGKVTLFTSGPLTNIAEALQINPELSDNIEMIYTMGGALEVNGNVEDQPSAEWNIYVDPVAAGLVFQSGVPITLIPLDATNQVPITSRSRQAFEENLFTPAAEMAYKMIQETSLSLDIGVYFWDPLAAAILTDNTLGTLETHKLEVSQSGEGIGSTIESLQGTPVQVLLKVENDKFLAHFLSVLNDHAEVMLPPEEDTARVKLGTFFISGKTCSYDGLFEIPAGRVSLDIVANAQEGKNALIVGTVDEGIGLADLIAWNSCIQPPWGQVVSFFETSSANEEQTELVFTVKEGQIFLVCYIGPDPCELFNAIGPIEVK